LALRAKDPEFHSLGLVLGYDYPDSPIVAADNGPRPEQEVATYVPSAHPGARLPHAWLPDGRSVYDLLGDGLTLLRLGPDADPQPLLSAASRRGIPMTVVDMSGLPQLRPRYGAELLVVRPDQHVAWRGDTADEPEALLARLTGAEVAAPRRVVGSAHAY
jgi:hypothetical protein